MPRPRPGKKTSVREIGSKFGLGAYYAGPDAWNHLSRRIGLRQNFEMVKVFTEAHN